jgi:hypothetical protein
VVAGLVLGADLIVIATFLRSDIPIQTLAVLALTASLIRIAGGAAVLPRTAAMRRALEPATLPEADHDGRR